MVNFLQPELEGAVYIKVSKCEVIYLELLNSQTFLEAERRYIHDNTVN